MSAIRINHVLSAALVLGLAGGLAGCATDTGAGPAPAASMATGPITIWYSNNPEEVAWGKPMVKAWNAEHPDEEVTGQEIPAGKTSEEVICASITAGTAPCLIYNTAPSAVPQFQKRRRPGGPRHLRGRRRPTSRHVAETRCRAVQVRRRAGTTSSRGSPTR